MAESRLETLGEQMPFSFDSEQAVLGAVLIDPKSMDVVGSVLKPEYFYLPQHQAIYTVFTQMYLASSAIDLVTVLEELKKEGVYDDAGGKAYLMELVQVVPSSANVKNYAEAVRDKYYERALILAARRIISNVQEGTAGADLLIDSAEEQIFAIRQGRDISGVKHIKDVIHNETIYRIDQLNDPEVRDRYAGIPIGIRELDRVLTGLHRSNLIILGARPGMGKTSFALNIARHVAVKQHKTVCFFSLEMTGDELAQRLLSNDASIASEKLRTGAIEGDEWTRLVQAAEVLSKAELYIDESPDNTVPQMMAKLRRMKNVDLVIIDYLQYIQPTGKKENRVQEVSEISRGLKMMAKKLDVPVLVCAQLSRNTEQRSNKSHKPQLSDLRESGSIEQDADVVLFLYRDEYYEDKDDPEAAGNKHAAKCLVAKNRHGETADVELYWDGQYTRFSAPDARP